MKCRCARGSILRQRAWDSFRALLMIVTLVVGGLVNYLIIQLVERTGMTGTDRLIGMVFRRRPRCPAGGGVGIVGQVDATARRALVGRIHAGWLFRRTGFLAARSFAAGVCGTVSLQGIDT